MVVTNSNFNQNSINYNIPVSNEPVNQSSVPKTSIQSKTTESIQKPTGFNSSAMQKSMDIQQQHQPTNSVKTNDNPGLLAPGKMPSQNIERPAIGSFTGTSIISQLEEDEKPLTAETAPSSFRELVRDINLGRAEKSYYNDVELKQLFEDGTMSCMADIIKAGDKNMLRDALYGGMSVSDKNVLYLLFNDPQFDSLAKFGLSKEDYLALDQLKDNFNSLVVDSEVKEIKDKMLSEGRVGDLFVKEHHSVFNVFCRAIANFFISIFGSSTKTLDQEDFINKAKDFASQHGYALHSMMSTGGLKEDDLTQLLLTELKNKSGENDDKLSGYAADMAKAMVEQLNTWEEGEVGSKILTEEKAESFIQTMLTSDYEHANNDVLSHELFHLLIVSRYDSNFLDDITSCCSCLSKARTTNLGTMRNIFNGLTHIQQTKLKSIWSGVRDDISAQYEQKRAGGNADWDNIKSKLDEIFDYLAPRTEA